MAPQRYEIFKQNVNDCVQHIMLQKFTNFHAILSWNFRIFAMRWWPSFYCAALEAYLSVVVCSDRVLILLWDPGSGVHKMTKKMHKNHLWLGSAQDPAGEAYDTPNPLVGWGGDTPSPHLNSDPNLCMAPLKLSFWCLGWFSKFIW